MLRPQRFEVEGESAIIDQLRELSSGDPLARDAERVFTRTQGSTEEAAFIARDGRWVAERTPRAAAADAAAANEKQLLALLRRIESLEGTVRSLERELKDARRAQPEPEPSYRRGASSRGEDAGYDDEPADHEPEETDEPQPRSAARAPVEQARGPMVLPPIAALADLVKSIAGGEANLMPIPSADWAGMQARAYYSLTITGAGEEVGALVFDLECALRLAGALMMESPESIAVMVESGTMSDEMHDAASEVCNTLMSAFNKISANTHVKASKLSPLDPDRLAWVEAARKSEHYRFALGGYLSLIAS